MRERDTQKKLRRSVQEDMNQIGTKVCSHAIHCIMLQSQTQCTIACSLLP